MRKELTEDFDFYEEPEATFSMHPKKFALYLFILSIVMIFASLTSAYIVKQSEGDWYTFDLPDILWTSSFIILISSIFAQWAFVAAKRDNIRQVQIALAITTILGIAFIYTQFRGWAALIDQGIYYGGLDRSGKAVHPAGSFVYVLMAVHIFHLVTGMIFLLIILVAAFRYQIHSKAMVRIEMCVVYWHFLGGLWWYLFLFLILNR